MNIKMHPDYKLKHAITIALILTTLGLQGNVFALGLSDIEIKSHLGQPLKAKINVIGIGEIKDASCFKLGNIDDTSNQLKSANFKLNAIGDDIATLTLTTAEIVNEPILNVSVIADCNGNVRRDYVVLIDPLLSGELDNTYSEEMPVSVENIDSIEKPIATLPEKQMVTTAVGKTKKSKTLINVPNGIEENSLQNPQEKITTVSNKPKLSVSGNLSINLPLNTGSLHMDKQLTFTPDANAQEMTSDIDIQDEVTAMNNRLFHLEKQLTQLQHENLKLKSENKLKTLQLAETESLKNKVSSLIPTMGGGLLLLSGYFSVSWWRRRQLKQQAESTEVIWTNLNSDSLDTDTIDMMEDEDLFANAEPHKNINDEAEKSASMQESFESTLNVENPFLVEDAHQGITVLDHADVFLSHGRTALAIQLLQNHLLDYPKQSVTIWLFLLDLLAKENLKTVYDQTALDCKEHFNIKISEFAKGDIRASHNLESFPHLAEGLQQVWNTPACIVYLDDLIYNNRLEPRAGLDKNLIEELILLKTIAQENLNSAEVIQLDEKKLALKVQKEALIATKRAEKLEEMNNAVIAEQNKAKADEKLYEFSLVEWK